MFAIREVLLDLRRVNLMMADALRAVPTSSEAAMQKLVTVLLYEVLAHVDHHMRELGGGLPQDPEEPLPIDEHE